MRRGTIRITHSCITLTESGEKVEWQESSLPEKRGRPGNGNLRIRGLEQVSEVPARLLGDRTLSEDRIEKVEGDCSRSVTIRMIVFQSLKMERLSSATGLNVRKVRLARASARGVSFLILPRIYLDTPFKTIFFKLFLGGCICYRILLRMAGLVFPFL